MAPRPSRVSTRLKRRRRNPSRMKLILLFVDNVERIDQGFHGAAHL
jgi:hypothetical protein